MSLIKTFYFSHDLITVPVWDQDWYFVPVILPYMNQSLHYLILTLYQTHEPSESRQSLVRVGIEYQGIPFITLMVPWGWGVYWKGAWGWVWKATKIGAT
jgi:hypothetical protein